MCEQLFAGHDSVFSERDGSVVENTGVAFFGDANRRRG
jgi:hypothetical protein